MSSKSTCEARPLAQGKARGRYQAAERSLRTRTGAGRGHRVAPAAGLWELLERPEQRFHL